MFKAIFWDNDGVLVNTEPLFFEATKTILQTVGVRLTHKFFVHECLKKDRSAYDLAREKGIDEKTIESLRKDRNKLYEKELHHKVPVIEGVEETLKALHGKIYMGIVTSSRRDHLEFIMKNSGLRKYFDFFITGNDVSQRKPFPEPYLKALKQVTFSPSECLVIEDSERGVVAAKKAGLTCWAIPNELSRENDFSMADKVLGDVREVAKKLI